MKKSIKLFSLILAGLLVVGGVIYNDNSAMASSSLSTVKLEIKTGNNTCNWVAANPEFNFGEVSVSYTNTNLTGKTNKYYCDFKNNTEGTVGFLLSSLTLSGNSSIKLTPDLFTYTLTAGTWSGTIATPLTQTTFVAIPAAGGHPTTLYSKGLNKIGYYTGYTYTLSGTIPAYTTPGVYTGTLDYQCNNACG